MGTSRDIAVSDSVGEGLGMSASTWASSPSKPVPGAAAAAHEGVLALCQSDRRIYEQRFMIRAEDGEGPVGAA